jgi:hypothetical protein
MVTINSLVFSLILGISGLALDQTLKPKDISPAQAKDHLGETATVCGKIVAVSPNKYGAGSLGWPISLEIDKPDPDPVFIIGVMSPKRLKPDEASAEYQGKQVCATGKITELRGVPAIVTTKASEIAIHADVKK